MPVKTVEKQSYAILFRPHQTLMRQRAQLICALRRHLSEYGVIVAQGNSALFDFEDQIEERLAELPPAVLAATKLFYHHFDQLNQSL